jgi:predicted nucleic acid-binding protein
MLHVIDVLIQGPMKTNVTLKLDADLIREARVRRPKKDSPSAPCSLIATKPWCGLGRLSTKLGGARSRDSARASTSNGRRPDRATSCMSDNYFVDTNILMYAHDTSAGAKHDRAKALLEELWRDRTGVVSTQVLQELSVNLRRNAGRPLDVKATPEIVADYLTWQVVVNGGESIRDALELEARYQISSSTRLSSPRSARALGCRCGESIRTLFPCT